MFVATEKLRLNILLVNDPEIPSPVSEERTSEGREGHQLRAALDALFLLTAVLVGAVFWPNLCVLSDTGVLALRAAPELAPSAVGGLNFGLGLRWSHPALPPLRVRDDSQKNERRQGTRTLSERLAYGALSL